MQSILIAISIDFPLQVSQLAPDPLTPTVVRPIGDYASFRFAWFSFRFAMVGVGVIIPSCLNRRGGEILKLRCRSVIGSIVGRSWFSDYIFRRLRWG